MPDNKRGSDIPKLRAEYEKAEQNVKEAEDNLNKALRDLNQSSQGRGDTDNEQLSQQFNVKSNREVAMAQKAYDEAQGEATRTKAELDRAEAAAKKGNQQEAEGDEPTGEDKYQKTLKQIFNDQAGPNQSPKEPQIEQTVPRGPEHEL